MSSCLYILDETLQPLISKNVKALPKPSLLLDLFKTHFVQGSPPVVACQEWYFIFLKRDTLWFISAVHWADSQTNCMTILTYMDHFYRLLKNYLGQETLDRNLILDNILLVMELMDESADFGIVQMTEPSILRDYIRVKVNIPIEHEESDSDDDSSGSKPKGISRPDLSKLWRSSKKISKANASVPAGLNIGVGGNFSFGLGTANNESSNANNEEDTYMNSYIAKTTIMPISWRTKGIYYSKNEFFLDVIEHVQYLMDFNQGIIRKNLIHGQIVCKSYLSGMPHLKIALNKLLQKDPQFLQNSKFHQCVSLDSLDKEEIEFIPPDGEFMLCKYELKRHVKDPPIVKLAAFGIKPKLKKFKLQISITIETHFKTQNTTSILRVKVPLTRLFQDYKMDLSKQARFKSDCGQVLFNLSDDFLLWEVGSMKGGHGENQKSMVAEFSLFNQEEYNRLQEELKTSMNPPPLRKGPKLEELYSQLHEDDDTNNANGSQEAVTKNLKRPELLSIEFEVPYSTSSGLKVEYLKINEEQLQYQSFPWIRYKTVNDEEYAYII